MYVLFWRYSLSLCLYLPLTFLFVFLHPSRLWFLVLLSSQMSPAHVNVVTLSDQ